MKARIWSMGVLVGMLAMSIALEARACIWDATTLREEKARHPKLAEVVLGKQPPAADTKELRQRISALEANRHEEDPEWWNNLGGAHIRLGELKAAVDLLEPAVKKFPDNYGVHANLGTAYHLLGRYADAEREIARDLEINPDAHFGLEKYHLALLQYLVRDEGYRSRHVYVDEFTSSALASGPIFLPQGPPIARATNAAALKEMEQDYRALAKTNRDVWTLGKALLNISQMDDPPPYLASWDLAQDPKLEEGVLYMASLNPKEPACFHMLGVLCWRQRDIHLTIAALKRAVSLGSPQADFIKAQIEYLQKYKTQSELNRWSIYAFVVLVLAGIVAIFFLNLWVCRRFFSWLSRRSAPPPSLQA